MSDAHTLAQDWPIGALIGFGNSWRTYEDPQHPDQVIKISQLPEPETLGFTHSELLRNLLHLLLPKNIPRVIAASLRTDQTRQLRVARVKFSSSYAHLVALKNMPSLTESQRQELHTAFAKHTIWVEESQQARELFTRLKELGVIFDDSTKFNVVQTPDDTPVYIDELGLQIDWDTFVSGISTALDPKDRAEFARLTASYETLREADYD